MPNENQNQDLGIQPDATTTPIDLAQAFKMLNQANRETAEEPVETGTAESESIDNGTGESDSSTQVDVAAEPTDEFKDNADLGGSTDVIEPIDFDARRQEILRDLQRQALDKVRQDFTANKITPCSIEDLYQRDESTGRVTFKNPDDPTHDFNSRAEAQQWVEAFNKQIEARFRQEVNRAQQDLMSANAPIFRLIAFAPKFNAMNKIEQEIMDDLIDNYAVYDGGGNVIGYNVDLDAAAAQAKKIAKRYSDQQQSAAPETNEQQAKEPSSTGPALDMPTGTGKSAEEAEPKNIGEALKMYDKQNKKGK